MNNHETLFWQKKNDFIQCLLCPHLCLIEENHTGICQVRKNVNGSLVSINYGKITSISLDPIEKKPLYHFYPGKYILSIGSFGCNMKCMYCQNYLISQNQISTKTVEFAYILKLLEELENNIGLAFTYNEPLISFEYVYDLILKIKTKFPQKKIVLVTNGFINTKPLLKIIPYIDALNIDLKAFNDDFYKKICLAKLNPVLNTIKTVYDKCHLEVTTLMVTNENDKLEEISAIAKFLGNLDKNIPLHLTRYFPNYHLKYPPTDIRLMYLAKEVAEKYLNYVYLGNISCDNNTYCHKCKTLVFNRNLYISYLENNRCPNCGEKIPLIM